jgi:hypothetical protein
MTIIRTIRRSLSNAGVSLLAIAFHVALSTPPSLHANPGLAGWWKFDEASGTTAFDSSGIGNHATLFGGCSFTTQAVLGAAVDFKCQDSALAANHSPTLEPQRGTIELWINIPVMQNSDILVKTSNILHRTGLSNGTTYGGVYGLRIHSDGRVAGYVMNDDPATPGAPWRFAYSPARSVTTGGWHHLAMRWDGSRLGIFVDGTLRITEPYLEIPGIGLSYGGTSQLLLGVATYWPDQFSHEFIGKIDDVRFYGYARTSAHILNDYTLRGTNRP